MAKNNIDQRGLKLPDATNVKAKTITDAIAKTAESALTSATVVQIYPGVRQFRLYF
jgi:hypothetical protein